MPKPDEQSLNERLLKLEERIDSLSVKSEERIDSLSVKSSSTSCPGFRGRGKTFSKEALGVTGPYDPAFDSVCCDHGCTLCGGPDCAKYTNYPFYANALAKKNYNPWWETTYNRLTKSKCCLNAILEEGRTCRPPSGVLPCVLND